jgi:hypothetical protein
MEKLYYNLSEEEYTTGRKVLLWIVTFLFFVGGIYIAMLSPVFGKHSVSPMISLAPFGIGVLIGITALFATIKRKDMFFLVDNDKIEFRYGLIRPKKSSFPWADIKKLVMPHRERKVKVMFKNSTSKIIDLSYIQRKKSILIRKHLYIAAREKNIAILKVISLAHHKAHNQ